MNFIEFTLKLPDSVVSIRMFVSTKQQLQFEGLNVQRQLYVKITKTHKNKHLIVNYHQY